MTDIKSKKNEVEFADRSGEVINEILKKYELDKEQAEGLDRFFKASLEEKQGILKSLPGSKIILLLLAYQEGSLRLEDFPRVLEKNLKISLGKAEEITKELKERIIVLETDKKEKLIFTEDKINKSKGPDVYREPTK